MYNISQLKPTVSQLTILQQDQSSTIVLQLMPDNFAYQEEIQLGSCYSLYQNLSQLFSRRIL